ncbi:hypothetical protein L3Q82_015776 [Scortum barcoo]|uniref:Uncharacterized protein n=1 Tax=Scortum barcoo TaxID=214431 RepID=A0ACB8VNR9_9TELE|nr:hypothetical protein L3Q82_015776 [Scortum barcoo]
MHAHSLGSGTQLLERGWTLHYSGVAQGERRRAGVGLLIAPQLSRHVLEFTPVNERGSLPCAFGLGIGLLLLFVHTGRSPPGGELDPLAEEEVGQTWQTQTYCEGLLGTSGREPSVREVFNSHLRKSFSQIPREAGDIESEWTMFSASIVDAAGSKLWTQGLWCLSWWRQSPNPVVDTGKILANRPQRLRRGKQYSANTVYSAGWGELLTSTGDIVGRWKKYFEDLLNPTDLPSSEEAEAGDSEVDSSITREPKSLR